MIHVKGSLRREVVQRDRTWRMRVTLDDTNQSR